MEAPLHPTPMQRPMMKGKIYVDASNKPTFQGIWGMTHADVNKGGHTNDFKVVRMEAVKVDEIGLPVFAGHYLGYFKLTTGFHTETVNESFTLSFRGHSNHGYNVYGFGDNRFGKTEIVGTVTQTGKMEIFKMIPGTTVQPDPNEPQPKLPRPANARAASPPPPPIATVSAAAPRVGSMAARPGGLPAKSKSGGGPKKKTASKKTSSAPPPPPSKNGLPGLAVRALKEALVLLRKGDKGNVFQFAVPPTFRGLRGVYADVIKHPMDLGTVLKQIDSKYRTSMECIEDVRLVFSNAKQFNPDTDPVHALATSLSGKFEAYVSTHRGALGLDSSGSSSNQPKGGAPPNPPAEASGSRSGGQATTSSGGGGGRGGGSVKSEGGNGRGGSGKAVPLTVEEQDKLAKDVNELFRVGNENPGNDRAQARVYALWSFANAYVLDKDRVLVDGGKGAEIRMDALNHMRQRQLRDVVTFFLEDSKNDPVPPETDHDATTATKPEPATSDDGESAEAPAAKHRKRSRTDLSDSEDEEDEDGDDGASPAKRSRDGSGASSGSKRASLEGAAATGEGVDGEEEPAGKKDKPPGAGFLERVDSSRLTLEATASKVRETEIDIDLEDEDEDDDDADGSVNGDRSGSGGEGSGDGGGGDGAMGAADEQWTQAQREKREMEIREKKRAANEKALEEQRLKQQAQRERERVEEGLKLSRERAAEKAKAEAMALEKANREKKELDDKKEAERIAREESKASVDLDQVRGNSKLMDMMDESVYDD